MKQWFERNRLQVLAVTHVVAFAVAMLSTAFLHYNMPDSIWWYVTMVILAAWNIVQWLHTMYRIARGDK